MGVKRLMNGGDVAKIRGCSWPREKEEEEEEVTCTTQEFKVWRG